MQRYKWIGSKCLAVTLSMFCMCNALASRGEAEALKDNAREFGLSTSYITNLSSSRSDSRFVATDVSYGIFRSPRQEILLQGTFLHSYQPRSSNGAGVMGILRYHLKTRGKLIPFIQGGWGVLYTNLRLPEQASGFQFQEKIGVGVRYFIKHNVTLTAELNGYHISNADLKKPNVGINAGMVTIGISKFF
jgi:hypothetical protein